MATDFRISTGLFSCRKLAQLERRLGREAALGHLVRFWGEVANSRPSGDLTGWTDEDFADAGRWDGEPSEFVRALLGCRFLDGEPGQYRVHGWEEHQPWVVGAEKRSEQGRAAAKARWERKYGFKQESPGKPDIPDAQSIDEQCCLHQSAMLNHADSNAPILSYPFLSLPKEKDKEEADVPASPETSRPAAVFKILPTKDGPFEVTEDMLEEFEDLHQDVNVKAQIHLMAAWLEERPSNLKTLRGTRTFILKWLSRVNKEQPGFQKQPESMAFRPCS